MDIYIEFRLSNDEDGPSYSSTPAFFIDKTGNKRNTADKHRGHFSGPNGSIGKRNSTLEVSETSLNETKSTIDQSIKASDYSSKVSDQSSKIADTKVLRCIISTMHFHMHLLFYHDVKL